jgi:type IV pilus assembly protein PilY1
MYHLRLTSDASLTTPDDTGSSWAYGKLAESSPSLRVGPITAAANVARDDNGRRWVYFGTGRLFSTDDIINTDRQAFFGLKEPVYTSGSDLGKPTFGTVTIEASTDPASTASLFDATWAKVYEGGAVDVDGNGSIDYAAAVAGGWNGFIQTLDSSKNGWVIQTSPGERILGTAAVFGGVVVFSSWQPPSGCTSFFNCLPEGTSTLYSPFYKSGTAFTAPIIGLGNDTYSGRPEVLRQRSLGTGLSSTPTIHVGETGKAFIQSSTGAIADTEIKTVYPVKSGVRSWRLH